MTQLCTGFRMRDKLTQQKSQQLTQQKSQHLSQGTAAAQQDKQSLTGFGLFKAFLNYYTGQRHLFWGDIACAITDAAIDLAFPWILRWLTGGLFTQGSQAIMDAMLYLVIGLAGMYVVRFLCRFFVAYWGHVMGARMESKMREDLFDAYERMSFSFFDQNKSGDLMSRLVNDLFDISEAAHHGPEFLLIGIIEVIGSFVILSFINVPLTLCLAVVLVLLMVYNVRANLNMRQVFRENRERISRVNSRLEDSLAGMRVVKSFTAEDVERAKFRRENSAYLDSKVRMYRAMGGYQASISALMGGLYTIIVCVGGWLIAQGQMQPQDLATYALYISLFTVPIYDILNFSETFQKSFAGFRRLMEMLTAQPDILDEPGARELVVTRGEICYHDVHFSYEKGTAAARNAVAADAGVTVDTGAAAGAAVAAGADAAAGAATVSTSDAEVLHGLNLVIEPGKTVALVGPSGGGKSTTCALLPRFYDCDAGFITIDGQDIKTVTQKSLREAIGIVQQDVYLFDGTIAQNIAYGRPSATFEQIEAAAKQAHIYDFIQSLPHGFETQVGERGARLSGGQKQRIAIARVFLKNPRILILDEATSALDNESEQAVQASLAALARGRTTIIIAHRLSTIKDADEIITISAGKVAEKGTHEELLARGGTYAHYYAMQFEGKLLSSTSMVD